MPRPTRQALPETTHDDIPAWQWERRQRIVRAALELLEDGEYDRIQIRDVASRSGFAVGTLYRYFNSKEHLYAAVMVEWARSFGNDLRRRPLRGTPPERLNEVARRVIRAFENRGQFLRLEMVLENSVDPDAVAILHQVGDRNYASFLEALPGIAPDTAERVVVIVTSVLATYLRQYASGHIPIDAVRTQVTGTIDCVFGPRPTWEPAGS